LHFVVIFSKVLVQCRYLISQHSNSVFYVIIIAMILGCSVVVSLYFVFASRSSIFLFSCHFGSVRYVVSAGHIFLSHACPLLLLQRPSLLGLPPKSIVSIPIHHLVKTLKKSHWQFLQLSLFLLLKL